MRLEHIFDQLIAIAVAYGPKLLGAIAVWIIGGWVVKAVLNGFARAMDKSDTDTSLKPFLSSLLATILKVMLVISVLSMLGIQMTSFIAICGCSRFGSRTGAVWYATEFCRWRDDSNFQTL